MKIKDYFEEKDQLRCPFCNINSCPPIDEEEWEEQYKEGFRYYCASCDKCFFEPVVDLSDIQKALEGMICSDCGEFNCDCDWYVLNRKNKELIEGKNMLNFSEVIKIIEAGLEGDRTKAIAYANLLTNKVNERQSQMIIDRITGEYKKKKVVKF